MWYIVITILVSAAVGVIIYQTVRIRIYGEVAEVFRLRSLNIGENILPRLKNETPDQVGEDIEHQFYPEASNRFIRITDKDHKIVYLSGPPKDGHFDPANIQMSPVDMARGSYMKVGDNIPFFVVSVPVIANGKSYLIEMGGEADVMESTLYSLISTQLALLPALVLILSGGGLILVRRSLAPVDALRRTAARITFGNLKNRLPVARTGDSIEYLSLTLNQMLTRLEDAYEQSGRFAADAAHELRTPLAIMRGELESFALEKQLAAPLRERVLSMLEESERLTHITDMLLAMSRLDAGESKVRDEIFDLAALVRDTADQMALLAEEKDIALDIREGEGVAVRGDPARLKEVVVNILDNAIKYTPASGNVELSVFSQEDKAVLEVRDNGIGIPKEALPHVFERFYRVDKARSREEGGTGLGLSIAQSICHAHQGSIEIESGEGQGTLCRVLLPLAA